MSIATVTESKLTAIGNGVRHVTGVSGLLTLDQMATTLNGISNVDSTAFVAEPLTWAGASWETIATILTRHYAGEIDISNIWKVGDTRSVSLSAMSATGVGESHIAQTVELVIADFNKIPLTAEQKSSLSTSKTNAAIVFTQKDVLCKSDSEYGYMNSSNVNAGGWNSCARRTWCNNIYKAALPVGLIELLKQVSIITSQGSTNHSAITTSSDYVFLPAEKEIYGSVTLANSTAEASLSQWAYFVSKNNRLKNTYTAQPYTWYFRSPRNSSSSNFCVCSPSGAASDLAASTVRGIAPSFCI